MSIYSTPPEGQPSSEPWVPGGTTDAGPYDRPEGSQRYSDSRNTQPNADSTETLYLDVDDPEYAITTAPLEATGPHDYAQLSGVEFDEQDDYVFVPVDPEGGV